LSGQQTKAPPDPSGDVQITLALRLRDAGATPSTFVLDGQDSVDGAFNLSSGVVTYGTYQGTVVGLDAGALTMEVTMQVDAPDPTTLVADLAIDGRTDAISGAVRGTAGSV
jgi:hypothetical protein